MKFVEINTGSFKLGVNTGNIAYIVKPGVGSLVLKICYIGGAKSIIQSDMNAVIVAYKTLSEGFVEVRDRNDFMAINKSAISDLKLNSQGLMLNIEGHPVMIDYNNSNTEDVKKAYCEITDTKYVAPAPKIDEAEIKRQQEETKKKLEKEREEAAKDAKARIKGATDIHNEKMRKARNRVN